MEYDVRHAIESPEGGALHISRFISEVPEHLREGGRAYFLLSSHTEMNVSELENSKKIAEKSLFFERLYVFVLSHKKDL